MRDSMTRLTTESLRLSSRLCKEAALTIAGSTAAQLTRATRTVNSPDALVMWECRGE